MGVEIKVEHLTKSFGKQLIWGDVTLTVPAGEVSVMLGPSGTGKSVLLKNIIGLLRPDEGRVFVRGREISALTGKALSEVRREIGFLFQNAALFDSISVGENVAFPMRRHTRMSDREIRDRATAKLESVGLGNDYEKMPGDLSGGMRKRAGLARAMALDPAILLVDEPSAGLDPVTSEEIDQLLITLKGEGTTLIVVTHNIPSARGLGDRLVMLHEGQIVADGTVEDFERSEHELVRAFMASSHSG